MMLTAIAAGTMLERPELVGAEVAHSGRLPKRDNSCRLLVLVIVQLLR